MAAISSKQETPAESVYYEVVMLNNIYLKINSKQTGDETTHNTLLESFLIHYRNLRDFLYPCQPLRKRKEDVWASDFAKGWNPSKWSEPSGERERINKMICHLSHGRARLVRVWEVGKMASRIFDHLLSYLGAMSEDERKPFEPVLNLLQARTADPPRVFSVGLVINAACTTTSSAPPVITHNIVH